MAGASVKRRVDGASHKIDTAMSPAGLGSCFAVTIVAEGGWPQSLADSMAAHLRTLRLLCGTSEILLPDNLKASLTPACATSRSDCPSSTTERSAKPRTPGADECRQ